jgi:uncharacterized SAM-binding protein YcdF (DUF218 family)
MDFALSKILGWLASPSNFLILLLCLTCLPPLIFWGWLVWPRVLLALLLAAAAVLPVGEIVLRPLEERFPRPAALPDRVAGVIVLGGSVDPELAAIRDEASTNERAERLHALLRLARLYPEARLVFTGGSALLAGATASEADVARRYIAEAGLDPARVLFETRNTRENALYSKELANPSPGETWLLVTSAAHMPRSVGIFRGVGWPVTAWPVDYQTSGKLELSLYLNASDRLLDLDIAAHEWLGLVYCRLRGWTDALLPAPQSTEGTRA